MAVKKTTVKKTKDGKVDKRTKEGKAINTEEALSSHERVSKIVEYIIEHFDQKTKRNSFYDLKGQRVNGFNSMFAVASIPMAKKYYLEFKKQLEEKHKDLAWQTTEFGKENAKVIRNYCEENDVDMKTFFPDQYWAESLGDGWFIPGVAEIELYTQFLEQPTGTTYKTKTPFNYANDTALWRYDVTIHRLELGYAGMTCLTTHIFFAPSIVKTSTLYKSEWSLSEENRSKFGNGNGKEPKVKNLYKDKHLNGFYRLTRSVNNFNSCLIYDYNTFGKNQYISSWTVAVKEF